MTDRLWRAFVRGFVGAVTLRDIRRWLFSPVRDELASEYRAALCEREAMRQKIATHRGERDRNRAAAALDAGRMDGEKAPGQTSTG